MSLTLKPYSAYKDSGVPWLGQVPAHWVVLRIKNLFREIDERNGNGRRVLLSLTRELGIVPQSEASARMALSDDLSKYKVCQPGDLVMNRMQAWSGMFAVSAYEGLISPDYCVFTTTRQWLNVRYFDYFFKTPMLVEQFALRSKGIGSGFNRLYTSDFGAVPIPAPSCTEQAAIVRFLDHMDRRIRRYIRAKQKLIKLLEEQKQAIIHQAVTRGLDPNVRRKPSGVEWLGDVPEHWDVKRLKSLVTEVTSGSRGWSSFASDDGPLFIRIGNLTRTSVDLNLSEVIRLSLPQSVQGEKARTLIRPGDLLLSITAFIGSVAVAPADIGEAYVSQHVARCRLAPGVANPRWLAYVLLSPIGQTHGRLCMYGGTKLGLSLDDVKNYLLVLPPYQEQHTLVDQIEGNFCSLDSAICRAREEISLILEYRTRLIADVVTGKLDVREAAAGLPDESDEHGDLEFLEEVGELAGDEIIEDAEEATEEVLV